MDNTLQDRGQGASESENTRRWDYELVPAVDIYEDTSMLTIVADMPGVPREALNMELKGNTLLFDGNTSAASGSGSATNHRTTRYHRSFNLTSELDTASINASLKDGVLTITVPRRQRDEVKKISIRSA